jgi:hypothetical protein
LLVKLLNLGLVAALVVPCAHVAAAQQPSAAARPRMTGSAPGSLGAANGGPAAADKPICKRFADIGSLIPRRKECHTRAEWDQLAQGARATGQAMADRSRDGGFPQ